MTTDMQTPIETEILIRPGVTADAAIEALGIIAKGMDSYCAWLSDEKTIIVKIISRYIVRLAEAQ